MKCISKSELYQWPGVPFFNPKHMLIILLVQALFVKCLAPLPVLLLNLEGAEIGSLQLSSKFDIHLSPALQPSVGFGSAANLLSFVIDCSFFLTVGLFALIGSCWSLKLSKLWAICNPYVLISAPWPSPCPVCPQVYRSNDNSYRLQYQYYCFQLQSSLAKVKVSMLL